MRRRCLTTTRRLPSLWCGGGVLRQRGGCRLFGAAAVAHDNAAVARRRGRAEHRERGRRGAAGQDQLGLVHTCGTPRSAFQCLSLQFQCIFNAFQRAVSAVSAQFQRSFKCLSQCIPLPFRCAFSLPFSAVSVPFTVYSAVIFTAFQRSFSASQCIPLSFRCAFHCLSAQFQCLSVHSVHSAVFPCAFHCLSRSISAFHSALSFRSAFHCLSAHPPGPPPPGARTTHGTGTAGGRLSHPHNPR